MREGELRKEVSVYLKSPIFEQVKNWLLVKDGGCAEETITKGQSYSPRSMRELISYLNCKKLLWQVKEGQNIYSGVELEENDVMSEKKNSRAQAVGAKTLLVPKYDSRISATGLLDTGIEADYFRAAHERFIGKINPIRVRNWYGIEK